MGLGTYLKPWDKNDSGKLKPPKPTIIKPSAPYRPRPNRPVGTYNPSPNPAKTRQPQGLDLSDRRNGKPPGSPNGRVELGRSPYKPKETPSPSDAGRRTPNPPKSRLPRGVDLSDRPKPKPKPKGGIELGREPYKPKTSPGPGSSGDRLPGQGTPNHPKTRLPRGVDLSPPKGAKVPKGMIPDSRGGWVPELGAKQGVKSGVSSAASKGLNALKVLNKVAGPAGVALTVLEIPGATRKLPRIVTPDGKVYQQEDNGEWRFLGDSEKNPKYQFVSTNASGDLVYKASDGSAKIYDPETGKTRDVAAPPRARDAHNKPQPSYWDEHKETLAEKLSQGRNTPDGNSSAKPTIESTRYENNKKIETLNNGTVITTDLETGRTVGKAQGGNTYVMNEGRRTQGGGVTSTSGSGQRGGNNVRTPEPPKSRIVTVDKGTQDRNGGYAVAADGTPASYVPPAGREAIARTVQNPETGVTTTILKDGRVYSHKQGGEAYLAYDPNKKESPDSDQPRAWGPDTDGLQPKAPAEDHGGVGNSSKPAWHQNPNWTNPKEDLVAKAGLNASEVLEQRPGTDGKTIFRLANGTYVSYDPATDQRKAAGHWDASEWSTSQYDNSRSPESQSNVSQYNPEASTNNEVGSSIEGATVNPAPSPTDNAAQASDYQNWRKTVYADAEEVLRKANAAKSGHLADASYQSDISHAQLPEEGTNPIAYQVTTPDSSGLPQPDYSTDIDIRPQGHNYSGNSYNPEIQPQPQNPASNTATNPVTPAANPQDYDPFAGFSADPNVWRGGHQMQ